MVDSGIRGPPASVWYRYSVTGSSTVNKIAFSLENGDIDKNEFVRVYKVNFAISPDNHVTLLSQSLHVSMVSTLAAK